MNNIWMDVYILSVFEEKNYSQKFSNLDFFYMDLDKFLQIEKGLC